MSSELRFGPSINLDNLRVSLRLCFDGARADRLTALYHGDAAEIASLGPVIRAATIQYESSRWIGMLRRRTDARPLLLPQRALPTSAGLSLAFHLGLGMTSGELASLMGRTPERIGEDLMRARRAIDPQMVTPCDEFASLIGRHRERVLDRDDALSLMLHLGTCDRCRFALERSREVDEEVLAELSSIRSTLESYSPGSHHFDALLSRPAVLWLAVVMLGLVLFVGGVAGVRSLRRTPHSPIPLVGSNLTVDPPGGWLLETSRSGEVDAVNVSSGSLRVLIPAPDGGVVQNLISPNQRAIAQVTTSADTGRPDHMRIFNLDGSVAHDWSLANPDRIRIPLAWLDDTNMVMCQIPTSAFSASFEVFTIQTDQQGSMVLFNVKTGDERTIFGHGARSAVPSPDGKFIAISRYSMRLNGSIELRPFDGKLLGSAVATLDEAGLPMFWSSDSQRIFFTQSQPLEITPTPRNPGDRGLEGQPAFSYSIDSLRIDGLTETVMNLPIGESGNVVGLSPDGTRLALVRGPSAANQGDWAFWEMTTDGTDPVRLAPAVPGVGGAKVVWMPSGNMLLLSAEPFYLPQAAGVPVSASRISYATLMLNSSGRVVKTVFDQLYDPTLIGYVDDLPPLTANDPVMVNESRFTAARLIPGLGAYLTLTSESRLSPGGNQLLVYDRVRNLSVTLDLTGTPAAKPIGAGTGLSWLPDGSGMIGVNEYKSQQGSRSRIAIYEPGSVPDNGLVEFDPANLGSVSASSYLLPQLSPDGLHCSFLVVDKDQVALWVAGRGESPRVVATWNLPPDARIDAPFLSEWISNDTLIVAAAGEWTDGYPLQVRLERVQVRRDGTDQVDPLISWHTHGGDQGISLASLQLSPDRTHLVTRLRHYTGSDPAHDRFDSIDVLVTSDLNKSLEVVRGKSGGGVSWAPDSTELVADLDGQLVVVSATGDRLSRPSIGSERASFPVWVRPNEIWFTSGSGNAATILRLVR